MNTTTKRDVIKTITKHYIDGEFVESHGREVMDIISPTNGKTIGRVTLGDEQDTRRAIAAAKGAFASFGRSTVAETVRKRDKRHDDCPGRDLRSRAVCHRL